MNFWGPGLRDEPNILPAMFPCTRGLPCALNFWLVWLYVTCLDFLWPVPFPKGACVIIAVNVPLHLQPAMCPEILAPSSAQPFAETFSRPKDTSALAYAKKLSTLGLGSPSLAPSQGQFHNEWHISPQLQDIPPKVVPLSTFHA